MLYYIRFYEKEENKKKIGKSLFFENRAEDLELDSYKKTIKNHVQYCQKNKYLLLIKNYAERKIDVGTFIIEFSSLI